MAVNMMTSNLAARPRRAAVAVEATRMALRRSSMWEFRNFYACALAGFVLASCMYRKNIRRPRLFLCSVGLFIGGLVMNDVAYSMANPPGTSSFTPPNTPSGLASFLFLLDNWCMYASLPLFVVACTGSRHAYSQCSHCGYNLTGNSSGVCPECGEELHRQSGASPVGE
jgi:hypothetical protein